MEAIRKAGLLGGGVIGGGWAARFALNGIDVTIFDPDPEAERKISEIMTNAERAYRRLTLVPLGRQGEITYTTDVAVAARDADFIQESAPEREELKRGLLAEASRVAKPDTIIASSSSGLLPSRLQADCVNPERMLIGHPFNPVYLMPLVEIVGGDLTSQEAKERAAEFYRTIGMHPLVVRKEVDAYIADRLMEAIWRESLHLVNDGVATADEIDQAVAYGPGLRWAFMGSFLTYNLAGGEAGMRHFMHQFGPALKLPWTKLEAPELTDELIDRIADQCEEQAAGQSLRDLERLRDDCLVSIMQALKHNDYAAGRVLKDFETLLHERSFGAGGGGDHDPSRPLRLQETRVSAEWVDYNGHLTQSRYVQVFGDASESFFAHIGADADYRDDGYGYYVVESQNRFLREVPVDAGIHVDTQVLGADEKRLHLYHAMHLSDGGTLVADTEELHLHVDIEGGRACPARDDVWWNLTRISEAHAALPRPESVGRTIATPGGK